MRKHFFGEELGSYLQLLIATTFDKNDENYFYQIFLVKLAFLYLNFVKNTFSAEQIKKKFFKSIDRFQSYGRFK